jgi:hypothetical protein
LLGLLPEDFQLLETAPFQKGAYAIAGQGSRWFLSQLFHAQKTASKAQVGLG